MSILGTEDARTRGREIAKKEAERLQEDERVTLTPFGAQNIHHLNRRLSRVVSAHERAFGYRPSAGLALDTLRSPTRDDDLDDLFRSVSGTRIQDRARAGLAKSPNLPGHIFELEPRQGGVSISAPPEPPTRRDSNQTMLREIASRSAYSRELSDYFSGLSVSDYPGGVGATMVTALDSIARERASDLLEQIAVSDDPFAIERALDNLQGLDARELGFDLIEEIAALDDAGAISKLLGLTGEEGVPLPTDVPTLRAAGFGSQNIPKWALGVRQVFEGTIYAPVGLAMIAQAGSLDLYDISRASFSLIPGVELGGDFTPERSKRFGEGFIELGKSMVNDPASHGGDWFLNLFAAASLGAGAAARVSAATRATGVRATTKAIVTRPDPGYFELGGAIINYSTNALVRATQRAHWHGVHVGPITLMDGRIEKMRRIYDDADTRVMRGPTGAAKRKVNRNARKAATITRDVGNAPIQLLLAAYRANERAQVVFDRLVDAATRNPNLPESGLVRAAAKRRRQARKDKAHLGQDKLLEVASTGFARSPDRLDEGVRFWRDYHEYMLTRADDIAKYEGVTPAVVVAQHKAHLAALDAADQVLQKAPDDVMKVVTAAAHVSDETASMKFGFRALDDEQRAATRVLAPVVAAEAVRKGRPDASIEEIRDAQKDAIALLHEDGLEVVPHPFTDDPLGFYVTRVPRDKSAKAFQSVVPEGGLSHLDPRRAFGTEYGFDGGTMLLGEHRVDIGNLLIGQRRKGVRVAGIMSEHDRALKIAEEGVFGSSKKLRDDWIPVVRREALDADQAEVARQIVEDGVFDKDSIAGIADEVADEYMAEVFPSERNIGSGGKFKADDVVWVDPDVLLGDVIGGGARDIRRAMDAKWRGVSLRDIATAINSPVRDITLFARLAYALNFVGAGVMNVIQQGPLAFPTFGRAVMSRRLYDGGDTPGFTDIIDALHGETRADAYFLPPRNAARLTREITKSGDFFRRYWTAVTDKHWRRSAVYFELKKQGIDVDDPKVRKNMVDAWNQSPHAPDTPPEVVTLRNKMVSAGQRAKRAVLEFDNLSAFEGEILRYLFFLYSFQRASFVWTLNAFLDHPVKMATLHDLGAISKEHVDEILGERPQWLERMPTLIAGQDEAGNPQIANMQFVLTSVAAGEMGFMGIGLFDSSVKYAELADELSPVAGAVVRGLTGETTEGEEAAPAIAALSGLVQSTPPLGVYRRWMKRNEYQEAIDKIRPSDPADPRGLIGEQNQGLRRAAIYNTDWKDILGPLAVSGLEPRPVDREASTARFWREQSPLDRHKNHVKLIRKRLAQQASIMEQPVPPRVGLALEFLDFLEQKRMDEKVEQRSVAHIELAIDAANEVGAITPEEATEFKGRLRRADETKNEHSDVFEDIKDAAGKEDVEDWVQDVRMVTQFRDRIGTKVGKIGDAIEVLRKEGLGDYTGVLGTPDTSRDAYGRRYLAWYRSRTIRAGGDPYRTDKLDDEAAESLRRYDNQFDEDITIRTSKGNVTFPSPERLRYALLTDTGRRRRVANLLNDSWDNLTRFEKELLGKKITPDTQDEWIDYENAVEETRRVWGEAGKRVSQKVKDEIAQQGSAEFQDEYRLSRLPRYARLKELKPFQDTRKLWSQLTDKDGGNVMEQAEKALSAYNHPDATSSYRGDIGELWAEYIEEDVAPGLRERIKESAPELELFFIHAGGVEFLENWF